MLYLISLGLHDEKDMSLKALETAKKCDKIYLELYTTKMATDKKKLERLIGKKIKEVERKNLEEDSDKILKEANEKNIGILVGGDALAATTHISLVLDAKKSDIPVKIIHGSSIFSAIGETGLQLYKFGKTTTLAYPEGNYDPKSFSETIKENKKIGLHTLVLLDVRPPKYMKIKEGLDILLKSKCVSANDEVVSVCDLGGENVIKYDRVSNLIKGKNLGKTPAVIIIPRNLHFLEKEFLESL